MPSLPRSSDGCRYDVFNDINSPIFVVDKDGAWSFFNSSFKELLGFKDLLYIEHLSEVKNKILQGLAQKCLQSKTSFFAVKICEYAENSKEDLILQIHKFVMHDSRRAFSGCIGVIQLVGRAFGDSSPLTKMELRVLDLMAKGYATKEISNLSGSSCHTIANHQKSIYKKLSAHTKITAINEGKKRGLLSD